MNRPVGVSRYDNQTADPAPVVRLVVVETRGSAPRGPGAAMRVGTDFADGTIGGGRLEYEAIVRARAILQSCSERAVKNYRHLQTWPLGPGLGQCCGGTVRVLFEHQDAGSHASCEIVPRTGGDHRLAIRPVISGPTVQVCAAQSDMAGLPPEVSRAAAAMLDGSRPMSPLLVAAADQNKTYFIEPLRQAPTPLFVYGAGHVGRALIKIVADLDFDLHWVDTHKERFPTDLIGSSHCVVAREPAIIANAAPPGAFHVVLTYSHAMDLAVCQAVLSRQDFGFLGLIGSATKRARFFKRLRESNISEDALSRLTCPIGLGELRSKEPTTIAISVAAQLLEKLEHAAEIGGQHSTGHHGPIQRIPA
ncbi:MAG: xanthine dehydrogenase accessory protein XdhC [Hyphomicrobiaceae bacterium]